MEIVIFGTGRFYQNRKHLLKKHKIVAFLDNDWKKQNTQLDGVNIYRPDQAVSLNYTYIVLMGGVSYREEMREQLMGYGIAPEKIILIEELQSMDEGVNSIIFYRADCEGMFSAKRKVLLITYGLSYTGAPIALFDMARILKRNGYYPVITCAYDGELREEIVKAGIPVVIEAQLNRKNRMIWNWVESFDFIVLNTLDARNLLTELNDCGKEVIWWLHEADMSYQYVTDMELIKNIGKNIHVYTVGHMPYDSYFKHTGNKDIKMLLYGVEDIDKKTIFAVIGMVSYRKAQDIFIEAVRSLTQDERKRAEFWIIGATNEAEYYKEIRTQANMHSEIKLMDAMPRSELERVSKQIDVLVCPSRSDPMPIVVTEFMRDGKTCIVSDMVGTSSYLKDEVSGLICKTEDVQSLTEKMRWVFNHSNQLEKIGQNARKLYEENFKMEVFENNLLQILKKDIYKE